MSSSAIDGVGATPDDLWLVRTFGRRSPVLVGLTVTLVVGTLCSAAVVAGAVNGVRGEELYRSGMQLWANSVAVGYIVWVVLYEVRRSRADLVELAPLLKTSSTLDPEIFARNRHPSALTAFTLAGVGFGLFFNVLVGGVLYQWLAGIPISWEYGWGPPLLVTLWAVAFHSIWILIDNSRLFAQLGEHDTRVDLNHLERLDALTNSGARHMLLLAIGLSVIPVQGILGGGLRPADFVPALVVILPVGLFLFARPALAVRRAIVRAKRAELERIDAELSRAPELSDRHVLLAIHRRNVASSPEWPVSLTNLARLALYLVIPPLAWVAAALVDSIVSRLI
jgi:hypothetical protein